VETGSSFALSNTSIDHTLIRHRKHVYSDLEPYICLFSDCTLGLRTFQSQREWINHEFQVYCINTQWWCNICNKPFDTQDLFRVHVEGSHQKDAVQLQAEEVFAASRRSVPRDARAEMCPFCRTAPAMTQKGFASHVGRHLQETSLVALPRPESPSDDETRDSGDEDESVPSSAASIIGSEAGTSTKSPPRTLPPNQHLELSQPDTATLAKPVVTSSKLLYDSQRSTGFQRSIPFYTLYDKVFQAHIVDESMDGTILLYIGVSTSSLRKGLC